MQIRVLRPLSPTAPATVRIPRSSITNPVFSLGVREKKIKAKKRKKDRKEGGKGKGLLEIGEVRSSDGARGVVLSARGCWGMVRRDLTSFKMF